MIQDRPPTFVKTCGNVSSIKIKEDCFVLFQPVGGGGLKLVVDKICIRQYFQSYNCDGKHIYTQLSEAKWQCS